MSLTSPETIALVSALGGGALVKLVDFLITRSSKRMDESSVIRKELREEIREYRKQMDAAEGEVDQWKERYFDLFVKCKEEAAEFKAQIEQLKRQVAEKSPSRTK